MTSLDLTRDWLRTVLKPYPAKDRIQAEVLDVLAQRRTVSVKTDAFSQSSSSSYQLQRQSPYLMVTDVQRPILGRQPYFCSCMAQSPSLTETRPTKSRYICGSHSTILAPLLSPL